MYLKSIKIEGLSDRMDCDFRFNRDINILTGINGSGKTTILKLVWYIISGNIERLIPEIDFREVYLSTSEYDISLSYNKKLVSWKFISASTSDTSSYDPTIEYPRTEGPERANQLVMSVGSSVYFPTFRRIEGGYSMANTRRIRRRISAGEMEYGMVETDQIQSQFDELANRISVREHRFVCSISTNDIVDLLSSHYAKISGALNESYKDLSTSIITAIEGAKTEIASDRERAYQLLTEIQAKADAVNKKRESLLKPFTILSALAAGILRHKGIRVRAVTLGESVNAIDSSVLSAGEKQMLSFLSYNAFSQEAIIFIDEPELSLHPDWQRRLFPTLIQQQSSNQFVVATHSPFIYSKYQDRELVVSNVKGE